MGFEEFSGSQQLIPKRGKIFRKDDHCEGVMMIPRDQVDILNTCELVEDGLIVLQVCIFDIFTKNNYSSTDLSIRFFFHFF